MSALKETQKIKVVQIHEQTMKQFFNPTPTPKIAHQGPKTSKMTPKLSQNQMSEFKVTQKMKVVQLHEQIPKQCLNPTLIPKIAHQGPKSEKRPKIKSKSKVEIEENKEKEEEKEDKESIISIIRLFLLLSSTQVKPQRASVPLFLSLYEFISI